MFNTAIRINPKHAWAHNRRGEVYSWGLMDKEKGLRDFDKAIALDSKFPYPYKNRGYIHLFNNNLEKAIIELDKCYELDSNPQVLFYKGKARIQIKDFKKGFEDVKKSTFSFEAYLKNSNDSVVKGMLAEAYYLCAYGAHELSMEKEKIEYLQKGCDMGVQDCCERLKKLKK